MIALKVLLWVAVVCVSIILIAATCVFLKGMLKSMFGRKDKE